MAESFDGGEDVSGRPVKVTRAAHISLGPGINEYWWVRLEDFIGPVVQFVTDKPKSVANPSRKKVL